MQNEWHMLLFLVLSQLWYVGYVYVTSWGESERTHTGSSRFNRGTIVMFPKVYAQTRKAPHYCSLFNHGTRVAFPKVYISSTEGLAPPRGMLYCTVWRAELKVRKREKKG